MLYTFWLRIDLTMRRRDLNWFYIKYICVKSETGFIRCILKHFEWSVQLANTLKEMVRFVGKVAGEPQGVRCTGLYMIGI